MRSLAAAAFALACTALHAQQDESRLRPEGTPIALVNAGFESTKPGIQGAPDGWWKLQHAGPESYAFTLDTANPRSGERSMRVANIGPEPFGTILQKVSATPYRGRTLRFAAWIRTQEVKGNPYGAGAGLKLHALRSGYPIAHVSMRNDAVSGTTGWARHELVLKVPNAADTIEVGLNLFGPGTAWLDDAELAVVDAQ